MRIEAEYTDGFTEHLLTWRLVVTGGKAFLQASWFRCKEPVRARFAIEEALFADAVALLAQMEPNYAAAMTDLDSRSLRITDDTTTVATEVYGAALLARTLPEIARFLELWKQLEVVVAPYLPKHSEGSGSI